MILKSIHSIVVVILILLMSGCSSHWTKIIRNGQIVENHFNESIDIKIDKGLIFVPVTIKGKEYRFLFDSGAPFSISEQLQNELGFKIISKGNIRDSDNNRKGINWVQVDSTQIGEITFLNQPAFVGDFEASAIISCLKIDGIVGSNLMRQCNWTIDQKENQLHFFDSINTNAYQKQVIVPFKANAQYSMYINLSIGQSTINNVLVDFGSNGAVLLSGRTFNKLKELNTINKTYVETGFKQTGIVGTPIEFNQNFTFSDSVTFDEQHIKNVKLRSGRKSTIGNNLLSRFEVTIDWNNQQLYLDEYDKELESNLSPGFKLGYTTQKGIYVAAVIKDSDAFQKGVRPNMAVNKIDSLDFLNGDDFCSYVFHKFEDEIFLEIMDENGNPKEFRIQMTQL